MSKKMVTAIFKNRISAEHAVDKLISSGIARDEISLLVSDHTRDKEFEIKKGSKSAEGASTGALTGGAVGAIAAGLAGVGTIATGGALLAAGPLVAALAGAGAGGAAGGILGGLIGLGFPEHQAKITEEELGKGKILIGANVDKDRTDSTKELLEEAGGDKVTVH